MLDSLTQPSWRQCSQSCQNRAVWSHPEWESHRWSLRKMTIATVILTSSSLAVILEPQIIPLQQLTGLNLKESLEESFQPSLQQPVLWLDGLLWNFISLFRYKHFTKSHGNEVRKTDILSATKCRHSHWSTGCELQLWLADGSKTNLWAFLADFPC